MWSRSTIHRTAPYTNYMRLHTKSVFATTSVYSGCVYKCACLVWLHLHVCVNTKISEVCAYEQAVLIKRGNCLSLASFYKSLSESLIAVTEL